MLKLCPISAILFCTTLTFSYSNLAFAWEQEPIGDGSPVSVWTQTVENSSFKAFKGQVSINAPINAVMDVITQTEDYPKWYFNNKEARRLEKLGEHKDLSYSVTKAPWPVSNRDSVTVSEKVDIENGFLITVKAKPDAYPRQEGIVRIEKLDGFWKIEKIAPNQTQVTLQISAEPGGDLPSWLANSTVVDMPFYTLTNLKNRVEKAQ